MNASRSFGLDRADGVDGAYRTHEGVDGDQAWLDSRTVNFGIASLPMMPMTSCLLRKGS